MTESPLSRPAWLLLLALLVACGCDGGGGGVALWPGAAGARAPLTPSAGSSGATRVSVRDGELVVELAENDEVVSTSELLVASAVLHLRCRLVAGHKVEAIVKAAPEGEELAKASVRTFALRKRRGRESVDLWFPLMTSWPAGTRVGAVALAMKPGRVNLYVERAEVVPMTPGIRVRCWWQDLEALRGKSSNFYLLSAVLPLLLLWRGSTLLRALIARARGRGTRAEPRRSPVAAALVAVIFVVWSFQGLRTAVSVVDGVAASAASRVGLSPEEVRIVEGGPLRHAFVRLVDRAVPPDETVGISPARTGRRTFWVAMMLAPRTFTGLGCEPTSRDLPRYIASFEECMRHPVSLELPPSREARAGAPWEATIVPAAEPRYLRDVEVPYVTSTFDAAEQAELSVVDEKGIALLKAPLARTSPHASVRLVEVPARSRLRVRVSVESGAAGDASVTVEPDGVRVHALQPGYVPVDSDELGNVVARRADVPPGTPVALLPDEERLPRRTEVPRLLATLLLLFAAGEATLRLLARGAPLPRLPERLGYDWVMGAGVAAVTMHLLVSLGLSHWPHVLAPLAVLVAAGAWSGATVAPRREEASPLAPDERVLLGIGIGLATVLFLGALFAASAQWDAFLNFGYRSRSFYHQGPTDRAVGDYARLSPLRQADPPGAPLLPAILGLGMGRWDDERVLAGLTVYFAAMLLLVADAVRLHGSRRSALFFAALAGTAPFATLMSFTGMADLPLACLLLAAVLSIERWRDERTGGWILIAGFLCALLTFTKREGNALALLVAFLACLKGLFELRGIPATARVRQLLGMACMALLPVLAWWHTYRQLGLGDWVVNRDKVTITQISSQLANLSVVEQRIREHLFVDAWDGGPHWNATYVMILALALIAPGALLSSSCRTLLLALLGVLAGYSAIYVLSPQGLHHLDVSMPRILIHVYPIAVALAGRLHGASRTPTGAR